ATSGYADAGGLMSYGPNLAGLYRRAAVYVDKILKGAKPADLPVETPTKFELVINLKTAKQIGLTIPEAVLYRVDRVIKWIFDFGFSIADEANARNFWIMTKTTELRSSILYREKQKIR